MARKKRLVKALWGDPKIKRLLIATQTVRYPDSHQAFLAKAILEKAKADPAYYHQIIAQETKLHKARSR